MPDEEWGERVRAYVVAAPGVTLVPEALRAAVAALLPKTSVPREIVIVPEIPRSPTGKVNRQALRASAR
jgi:fatty-acyl-CoA synthase